MVKPPLRHVLQAVTVASVLIFDTPYTRWIKIYKITFAANKLISIRTTQKPKQKVCNSNNNEMRIQRLRSLRMELIISFNSIAIKKLLILNEWIP